MNKNVEIRSMQVLSQILSINNKISACNSSQQMKYGMLEDGVVFSPVHVTVILVATNLTV